jgi:hypothetical protein
MGLFKAVALLAGLIYASMVAYLVNAVLDHMGWGPLESVVVACGTGLVSQIGLFLFVLLRTPSPAVRIVLTVLLLPSLMGSARILPDVLMGGQYRVLIFCVFAFGLVVYAIAVGSLWFGPRAHRPHMDTTRP